MTGIEVLGIDNVLFAVGDIAQARAFYEEGLGLSVKFAFPDAGIVGYRLGAEEPGLVLRVQDIAPQPARDTPRVWLEVPDARAAVEGLLRRGIGPAAAPFEINTGWVVEVVDPWGNVLGLTDYTKDPARARK